MSTKYEMWLNYDNDKIKYSFPMLPESLQYSYKGLATSSEIDKFGEIFHKGKRGAGVVSFSGIFPPTYSSSYCNCKSSLWKTPKDWVTYIRNLMNKSKPAHFVLTGGPMAIDIYVIITSFTASEEGGDVGAVHFSLEMKEYRSVTVTKITKKKSKKTSTKSKAKKETTKKRTSNKKKSKTYTVKKGDCLWNIAKKYYGNGAQYTKIYNANKSKIKNKNLIYPGQVLTIP